MRLFVAAHPPADVLEETERAERFLRRRIPALRARFVPVFQRHLTLSFLGEVDEGDLEGVKAAVHEAAGATEPFELRTAGLGVFPGPRRPRVFWLGLEGATSVAGELARGLAARMPVAVADAAAPGGFVPHVTLARVKALAGGNEATVRDALSAYRAAHLPWRLTHVALYASVLTPDGAVHRVLTRAELGKAPPAASP